MTTNQKQAIDKMTEEQLEKQLITIPQSKLEYKAELLAYVDECLRDKRGVNRSEAMVVETDMSDFGDM